MLARNKTSGLRLVVEPARREEEEARQEFARARQQAQGVEEVLARVGAAMAGQDDWARGVFGAGGPANVGFYRQCAADLREALLAKRAELAKAQEELHTRQGELASRTKRRKGLEQVLRRREVQAALEASRGAAKELDQDHAARLAWRATHGAGAAEQES